MPSNITGFPNFNNEIPRTAPANAPASMDQTPMEGPGEGTWLPGLLLAPDGFTRRKRGGSEASPEHWKVRTFRSKPEFEETHLKGQGFLDVGAE